MLFTRYSTGPSLRICLSLMLLCPLAVLSGSCGGLSSDEDNPPSTEIGNPPVIDDGRIRSKPIGGEVHLIGEPGAVTPGGARISIINQRTNAKVSVTTNDDGSFDVIVEGKVDDEYELSADGAKATTVSAKGNVPAGVTAAQVIECQGVCFLMMLSCDISFPIPKFSDAPPACVEACLRGARNSRSCDQADEWNAMTECCTRMEVEKGCEVDLDECQRNGCAELRPSGAAEGCVSEPEADCSALIASTQQQVEALLDSATCETHADCVDVMGCGIGKFPIPRNILTEYGELTSSAECQTLRTSCFGPVGAVSSEVAACENATCVFNPDCSLLEDALERQVQELLEGADRSCETADDCVTAHLDLACFHRCDLPPISRRSQAQLDDERGLFEQQLCGVFSTYQCRGVDPETSCSDNLKQPECENNLCVEGH